LGPKGPLAISQTSAVEVPVSAMHFALGGHYGGNSNSAPEQAGSAKITGTPEFRKFRVPAEFRFRSNEQRTAKYTCIQSEYDAMGAADWRLKSFGSKARGVCGRKMEKEVTIFALQAGVAGVGC
jgi:hypothetical protein